MKLKLIILILSFITGSATSFANCTECEKANKLYANGNYMEAAQIFQSLVDRGYSAPNLYYNLGNAYYKSGEIAKAILNFEKAIKLNPLFEDAKFNLNIANQLITDEVFEQQKIPVLDDILGYVRKFNPDFWAVWASVFSFLSFLTVVGYIFGKSKFFRMYSFIAFFVLIAATIFFWLTAADVHHFRKQTYAIIMDEEVSINSEPKEDSKVLFVIHSGSKVKVLSESSEFFKIQIPDGSQGWIAKAKIEII